jgi:hypothetical protein
MRFSIAAAPDRYPANRFADRVSNDGQLKGAILIENKVTDGFQENQPQAYAAEVSALHNLVGEAHGMAVLVTPENNAAVLDSEYFSATIHVEEIVEHLSARLRQANLSRELRSRLEIKIKLLEAICGKRPNNGRSPQPIPERRDFGLMYEDLVRETLPGWRIKPSVHGRKATTRFFDNFPGQNDLPYPAQLKHEFGHDTPWKYVVLQFKRAGHLVGKIRSPTDLLPRDGNFEITKSGGSLLFRIRTPGIDPNPDRFEQQRQNLLVCVEGLRKLSSWLAEKHARIAQLMHFQ